MALSESLDKQAWRELFEPTCAVCGKPKVPKQSFCRACYFKLSPNERATLYTPMSEGYASIYDELKTKLKAEAL